MANGHGGYRKPAHPAPVSGPGKYSRRTDGGPAQSISTAPDQPYGEAKQQAAAQRLAPMAGTAPVKAATVPSDGGAPEQMQMPPFAGPSLTDPSQRPNEPVTAGVNIGPGPDASVLNLPSPAQGTGQLAQTLAKYAATDATGMLASLMLKAQARNA